MTNVARTGQTVLIVASSMLFAAFTSAMAVRRAMGGDWQAPALPAWVWGTLLLAPIASWLVHRERLKAAMVAGSLLVASQFVLLTNLTMASIGDAFCAVLVASHAAHAAAGVLALGRFGARAGLFWHFVGVLWIYVLFVFGAWA